MTTTYHDNIASGAPANASTFNNPLGDLDQAIVGLQSTINGLVIGSGTSQAEVIAARNGYTVLDGRFDDLYLVHNVMLVDANFAVTNTAAKRFKTISLAVAACTGGETIFIAPGIYVENVAVNLNNVTLWGSGQPEWTGSGLAGGTIIQGYINLYNNSGQTIRDLGIDGSGLSSSNNGINSTATSENTFRKFLNLTIWGPGGGMLTHGIYGSGHHNLFQNIKCIDWYHGTAIHGSFTEMNNLYYYRCVGTSLVIKAKSGITVEHVDVSNLVIEGDPSAGTALLAASLDLQTANSCILRYINIANVSAVYCNIAALYIHQSDGTGTISDISVTNMASSLQQNGGGVGDFRFSYGTHIVCTNCRSNARVAGCTGFMQAAPADVSLHSCFADASGTTTYSGVYVVVEMNGSVQMGGPLKSAAITINTDSVYAYPMTGGLMGILILTTIGGADNTVGAMVIFRAASSPFTTSMVVGSNVNLTTGVLTGTTGTAGKLTISAATDGNVYIENRRGVAITLGALAIR